MTFTEFSEGWRHFCDCIDFSQSALDAEAIRFMNEMPSAVAVGLTETVNSKPCESDESSNVS